MFLIETIEMSAVDVYIYLALFKSVRHAAVSTELANENNICLGKILSYIK